MVALDRQWAIEQIGRGRAKVAALRRARHAEDHGAVSLRH
jgi:hypothetical protein